MVPGWAAAWTHQSTAPSCGYLAQTGNWQHEAATIVCTSDHRVAAPSDSTPLDLPGVVELHNNPGSLGSVDALQVRLQPPVLGRAVLVVGPPVKEQGQSAWQAIVVFAPSGSPAKKVGMHDCQGCSHIVAQRDDVGTTCTRSQQTERWWL